MYFPFRFMGNRFDPMRSYRKMIEKPQYKFNKSTAYFLVNVPSRTRNSISNFLHIPHKASINKYLGIENIVSWKDSSNSNDLMMKLKKSLQVGK